MNKSSILKSLAGRVPAALLLLCCAIPAGAQDERKLTMREAVALALQNSRDLALARLADRLARGLATPKRRRPTRPTAASRERRLGAKRQAAERKRDRRPPEE